MTFLIKETKTAPQKRR